jgi:hypothetical protein
LALLDRPRRHAIISGVSAPLLPAHSHTASVRLKDGEEVLVVRVLTRGGVAGYGFTFREDVAAARTMACWDAAARAKGQAPWQLLRQVEPATRAALEASAETGSHPWCIAWRAMLAGSPGAVIDWTLEPGFTTLHWIDPELRKETPHGRTAD